MIYDRFYQNISTNDRITKVEINRKVVGNITLVQKYSSVISEYN